MKMNRLQKILLTVFASWAVAAFLVPIFSYSNVAEDFANALHSVLGLQCHQLELRSMFLYDYPLGLCSRCLGICVGVSLALLFPFRIPNTIGVSHIVFLLPFMVDVILDLSSPSLYENYFRFIVSLIFAVSMVSLAMIFWRIANRKTLGHATMASLCLVLVACATSRGTINAFYEPSYTVGSIKSLAVPVIRNARIAPSESMTIGRTINRAIASKNPQLKLVSANSFNKLINSQGAVGAYADFIKDYVTSGIANQDFMSILVKADIDAIMICELSRIYQRDGSYGLNKAETRVTLSFTIINTKTNDVVWSASADGVKGSVTTVSEAPPMAAAIELAVRKIMSAIPRL